MKQASGNSKRNAALRQTATSPWERCTPPGYCGEIIHLYGAAGLHFGQQHLDEGEYLDVVRMPLDEAVRRVMTGEIKDAKTAIAILKLKERINP